MTLRYTSSAIVQQSGILPGEIVIWDGLQLVCHQCPGTGKLLHHSPERGPNLRR